MTLLKYGSDLIKVGSTLLGYTNTADEIMVVYQEEDAPYIQGWNTNSFQDPSINSGILPVQIIGV